MVKMQEQESNTYN